MSDDRNARKAVGIVSVVKKHEQFLRYVLIPFERTILSQGPFYRKIELPSKKAAGGNASVRIDTRG